MVESKEEPINNMWTCFTNFFDCEHFDCPHYNQCLQINEMNEETRGGYY